MKMDSLVIKFDKFFLKEAGGVESKTGLVCSLFLSPFISQLCVPGQVTWPYIILFPPFFHGTVFHRAPWRSQCNPWGSAWPVCDIPSMATNGTWTGSFIVLGAAGT